MTQSRIAYEASPEVRDVIRTIGRTEDIKLSPDNQRLAVADYLGNRIFLFSFQIDRAAAEPQINILDYSIISSGGLQNPHGITFLGNEHLMVCNRSGGISIFEIPLPASDGHERQLKPRKSINGRGFLLANVKTPGSLDSCKIAVDRYRVLVCNNHWHFVTSHIVEIGNSIRIRNEGIVIENGLKIPDGICYSADGTWIAISNHVFGEVLIYRNTSDLNKKKSATAILRGLVCPHGIRFSPDGARIFVADAASQYMHVFQSNRGVWHGDQHPSNTIRMLDDDSFYAGRYAAREGGIKGVDVDSSATVLVTTRKHDVIAFYNLNRLLQRSTSADSNERIELCRQRDEALQQNERKLLDRKWNYRTRALYAVARSGGLLRYARRALVLTKLCRLYLRNRFARQPVLEPSGPIVSMTTHGHRLALVFYAIESIAAGTDKPSRLILWLEDRETCSNPPPALRRLVSRGLEIRHTEGFGPHTKYFPYVDHERELHAPLITADDDILYPPDWLRKLVEAYEVNPSAIHCHRAHRIGLNGTRIMPYNEWKPCSSRSPSHLNFLTGVGGVIYPADFLDYLKQQGRAFEHCCPSADDIWLTVSALRAGFKIAQVDDVHVQSRFSIIPRSQRNTLMDANVVAGGNQYQLMRTLSAKDVVKLRAHSLSESKSSEIAGAP